MEDASARPERLSGGMDLFEILARLMGAFYALGGAFTLRAVAGDAVLDKALSAISMTPPDREDVIRRWVMTFAAVLTGMSGIALMMLSGWATPLFLTNLALQAAWLVYTIKRDASDPEEALGRRRRVNAAVLWTLVTALVLWLGWRHRLSALLEPWTPALMTAALVAGIAWVLPHLTWNPASPPRPEELADDAPLLPMPDRVRLELRYGYLPLWDADTGFAINAADHVSPELFQRLVEWENAFHEAVDPSSPDEGPDFTAAQAVAHRDEGLAIAEALAAVFGSDNVDAPLYGKDARPRLLPEQIG